jgi:hypothetical protein
MVETGAFEKIPLKGSITGRELSCLVGIDETAIGVFTRIFAVLSLISDFFSQTHENPRWGWNCRGDGNGYICSHSKIEGVPLREIR